MKFEFIEHTIRFVCLALPITMIRSARDSDPLPYSPQKYRRRMRWPFGHWSISVTETTGDILTNDLTILLLARISWTRISKTRVSIVYPQFKFDEIQNDYLTQTLVFLAGSELEKINFCLWRWINSLTLRKYLYI